MAQELPQWQAVVLQMHALGTEGPGNIGHMKLGDLLGDNVKKPLMSMSEGVALWAYEEGVLKIITQVGGQMPRWGVSYLPRPTVIPTRTVQWGIHCSRGQCVSTVVSRETVRDISGWLTIKKGGDIQCSNMFGKFYTQQIWWCRHSLPHPWLCASSHPLRSMEIFSPRQWFALSYSTIID